MSPRIFKQVIVPHYRRITDLLRRHGVDIIWVDCDGKIDLLIPLWMDAGINCMFPLEIGTWNADPVVYLKTYGRELLLMGGFDKRILAGQQDGILSEIERLAPLVEEGGFIPFCGTSSRQACLCLTTYITWKKPGTSGAKASIYNRLVRRLLHDLFSTAQK